MKYDEVLSSSSPKRSSAAGSTAATRWPEQYYNDAVRASIRFWSDVNKTGNPVSESTVERFLANIPYDGTLESILDQKYVALFWTGFEAWHEYRRTGYPALVIGEGTQNDHVLPTRMASSDDCDQDQSRQLCRGGSAFAERVPWSRRHEDSRMVECGGRSEGYRITKNDISDENR